MKNILALATVGLLAGNCVLQAQDASAIADRQAAEERYQKLLGKVEDLTASIEAQNKKIADLQDQIKSARDEQAKVNPDVVGRDELKALALKLKEVDEQRAADKELIIKEIGRLAQVPAVVTPKPKPKPVSTDPVTDPNAKYEGYEHIVKSGDTLSKIVTAYREQGVKVTLSQVTKHPLNAKVDPNKLLIGQKVFIPDVK
jgi:LysM repeat protein